MPEGDTIFRSAATLRKALAGKNITGFQSSVELAAARAAQKQVVGRVVQAVEPHGKHLLMVFRLAENASDREQELVPTPAALGLELLEGDLVLHTHMRMTGSWHIYRPGEAWQKPARLACVVITTADFVVPCFSAPVVELLTARETSRHRDLVELGPDAMTPEFDAGEALARIRRRPDLEIGVALLDQRAMAGVGNIYKSEVLFIRRVSPFLKVRELEDQVLLDLVKESHRLLRLNQNRGDRRTVRGLDEREHLWVYGRRGERCRICGEIIQMRRQGMDARSTYYCWQCQIVNN